MVVGTGAQRSGGANTTANTAPHHIRLSCTVVPTASTPGASGGSLYTAENERNGERGVEGRAEERERVCVCVRKCVCVCERERERKRERKRERERERETRARTHPPTHPRTHTRTHRMHSDTSA